MIVSITDNLNGSLPIANARIDSVTCDEPRNTGGDGNTVTDIVISADCKSVELRAERIGGSNGRVYWVFLSAADSSSNRIVAQFKVSIPKSQGRGKEAIDDGPVYTVYGSTGSNLNKSGDISVQTNEVLIPKDFQISNYPNPFNPRTRIVYSLPEESDVEITIYNSLGQRIEGILSTTIHAGIHGLIWNAGSYSSGLYLLKMTAYSKVTGKTFNSTRKLLLLK